MGPDATVAWTSCPRARWFAVVSMGLTGLAVQISLEYRIRIEQEEHSWRSTRSTTPYRLS